MNLSTLAKPELFVVTFGKKTRSNGFMELAACLFEVEFTCMEERFEIYKLSSLVILHHILSIFHVLGHQNSQFGALTITGVIS